MASSGTLPKTKSTKISETAASVDIEVQSCNSEFSFELLPKPKVTCIPENCSQIFDALRKTQSLCSAKGVEAPEKSWSVIFIGAKRNYH